MYENAAALQVKQTVQSDIGSNYRDLNQIEELYCRVVLIAPGIVRNRFKIKSTGSE